MHDSEKVITDCQLWGTTFCSLEPQYPNASVSHRVEVIMADNKSFGFYCRTQEHCGVFALSSDPHFPYVQSLKLDQVFHRSHGGYDSRRNPSNRSAVLTNASFFFRFVRNLAENSRKPQQGLWGIGPKQMKEHFHSNPQRNAAGNRYSDDGIPSCDSDCQVVTVGNARSPLRTADRVSIPLYNPSNHHHDHREISCQR